MIQRRTATPYKPPSLTEDGALTISLPLPPAELSPNKRVNYHKKASKTRSARHRAKLEIILASAMFTFPKAFSKYSLTFYHNVIRDRDDDNAAASCKAYRDGIADGLRVDDKTLRHSGNTDMLIDRNFPRLEITLFPAQD